MKGLCECGCGERTRVPRWSDRSHQIIRGEPLQYVYGHWTRPGKLIEIDSSTQCWNWLRAKRRGYGVVGLVGKTYYTHRLSYMIFRGPIPPDKQLDHLCRNPACLNPAHLEVVTHAENGRRGKHTRLSWETIHLIRSRVIGVYGEQTKLAKEFGVTPQHIGRIIKRKHWLIA